MQMGSVSVYDHITPVWNSGFMFKGAYSLKSLYKYPSYPISLQFSITANQSSGFTYIYTPDNHKLRKY